MLSQTRIYSHRRCWPQRRCQAPQLLMYTLYAAKRHHATIIRAEVPGPPYAPWYRGASISILFHFYVLIRASISKAPRGVSGVLLFELPSSRSYGAASLEQLLLLELLELPSSVRHTRTALTCT